MEKLVVLAALFGCSYAGVEQSAYHGHGNAYGHVAPAVYGQHGHEGHGHAADYAEHGHDGHGGHGHGAVYAQPGEYHDLKASAPHGYQKGVPAAAIRTVEQVDVTKTITPVITKQTTHQTHSEPAIAIGHVHGYTQTAHGPPQYAPVQYNTRYTTYSNPTVGVNGPVTFAGPAISEGVAVGVQPAYDGHGVHGHQSHHQHAEAPVVAAPIAFTGHQGHAHHYAAPVAAGHVPNYGHAYAGSPFASHGHGHGHGHEYAAAPVPGAIIAHTDFDAYAHTLGFKK